MKRGFTLVELLGVIIILTLLIILVFPSIVNSIRGFSKKTDKVTLDIIYDAANLYIQDHEKNFPKIDYAKYIVDLKDLINEDHLVSPITISESDDDITDKKCVQVSYNNGFNYELKNYSECVIRLFYDVNIDVNGDRKFNNQDPIILTRYLASKFAEGNFDKNLIKGDEDVNGDGYLSVKDINLLSELLGFVKDVPGIHGDVDGDGVLTMFDKDSIQKYISGKTVDVIMENIDVNGDGTINVVDVSAFSQMLAIDR